ncbi:glycosyltransferase family 4 protein [Candidatus Falkowbacteria bacterium]|nr:glycosyltransferase family 4 protein [Candidatus Falkowbacteria bacterium]
MKHKVLILNHTPFVGGAQLAIIDLLEKIDRERFEPVVVNSNKAEELGFVSEYERLGVAYRLIPFERMKVLDWRAVARYWSSVKELRRIVVQEKPCVIFCNTVRADLVAAIVSLMTKTKAIWYVNDYTFPRPVFRLLQIIPRKIIFVSAAVAGYYGCDLKKNKFQVIHPWSRFDERLSNVSIEDIQKIREGWKAGPNNFVVGFVGRLVEWKGAQVLVKAIKLLKDRGASNIKCVIIGSGQSEPNNEAAVHDLVADLDLGETVVFTGHVKLVAPLVKSLDLLCLTSIEPEPYSTVVVEAMLARVPTIGTDLGGTPEAIKHERTGLLVRPDDAEGLAEAIIKIMDDQELRNRLIDNGLSYASENNTAVSAARRLEQLFVENCE